MEIDSKQVAAAHDAMAEEYDELDALWYAWLYIQIHEFICRNLSSKYRERPQALDVGCGTGFQSFLLAQAGFNVVGFDISRKLLDVASMKIPSYAVQPMESPLLFNSKYWANLKNHHNFISKRLELIRSGREVSAPQFMYGDILDFDFGIEKYDIITCCGSVLSFVDSYSDALARMAKALKKNGILIIEVEQKWNLDLFWPIIDNIIGGRLGYEQSWSEIFHNIFSPLGKSVQLEYPFELQNGESVILPIWLFSICEIKKIIRNNGLYIKDKQGIHWATNLIPSQILHQSIPSGMLTRIIRPLAVIDKLLGGMWPFYGFGCSIILALSKEKT